MDSEQFRSTQESFNRADFMADASDPNVNTPAEIYANVRNKALEEAWLEAMYYASHSEVAKNIANAIVALKSSSKDTG